MTNFADRTADELAIRNLIAELAWQADHAAAENLDTYIACFTENAQWEVANTQHANVCEGHEAIREAAIARRKSGDSGPGSNTFHLIGCTVVNVADNGTATGKSYVQAYAVKFGVPSIFMMGEYHDQYICESSVWKLSKRVVTFH